MEPAEVMAAVSLLIHMVVLYVQARTKADVAELKATMYKEFATKDDFRGILRNTLKEHL